MITIASTSTSVVGPEVLSGMSWRAEAACAGPAAQFFFPPSHFERKPEKDARESAARSFCAQCRARGACLEYALAAAEQHGIWGGLNELQRSRLRRRALRDGLSSGEAAASIALSVAAPRQRLAAPVPV